jgi:uridylate kinase
MSNFVVSLGGSVAFPNGPDVAFIKRFAALIKGEARRGQRFVIAVGGGGLCRLLNEAVLRVGPVSKTEQDWLGIYVTRLNARFLRAVLGASAKPILFDERFKIKSFGQHRIVVAAGWQPGWSTDFVAAQIAVDWQISQVVNLAKPSYVYTSNPDQDKTAKPIEQISWKDYLKIIPKQWTPGLNAPFDPVASRLAQKNKLAVIVAGGHDLANFKKILAGKKFCGTIIS